MPKCADRTALCPMVGAGAPGCRLQHVGRGDAEQRVAEVMLLAVCRPHWPCSDPRVWTHAVGWLVHT